MDLKQLENKKSLLKRRELALKTGSNIFKDYEGAVEQLFNGFQEGCPYVFVRVYEWATANDVKKLLDQTSLEGMYVIEERCETFKKNNMPFKITFLKEEEVTIALKLLS